MKETKSINPQPGKIPTGPILSSSSTLMQCNERTKELKTAKQKEKKKLVGWLEFNVPFQHNYGYITDEKGRSFVSTWLYQQEDVFTKTEEKSI